MIKIAFINQKGGVGKSTSTVNIGAAMVKHFNKKVLIVDCDEQCNSSQQLRGDIEDDDITLYEHFTEGIPLADVYEQLEMKIKGSNEPVKLFVIPSNKKIGGIELQSVYQMRDALLPLEEEFDFCFFDMPPQFKGLGSINTAADDFPGCSIALGALIASDYVIVPTTPQTSALSGLGDLVGSINDIRKKGWNIDLKILGVLVNMVDERVGLQKYLTNKTKEDMDLVFNTHIKRSADIEYAEYEGKPVVYMRKTPAAEEYKTLAREILRRVIEMEKEKGHIITKIPADVVRKAIKDNKY